ncbi:MAG: flagellar biosynthesis anti-sigma factor FlgM [Pirellulales bacterium]
MQIYGPSHVHGPQSIQGPHAVRPAQTAGRPEALQGDRVEISEAAQLAAQVRDMPPVREDLVARVRSAIADGSYESDDKLAVAVDRLLDEMA